MSLSRRAGCWELGVAALLRAEQASTGQVLPSQALRQLHLPPHTPMAPK